MEVIPSNETQQQLLKLVALVTIIFLVWYLPFLWKRRNLYRSTSQLPGPFALPFVGSAFYFIGGPSAISDQITRMFNVYPGLFKVWFGTRLFYVVSDPKYLEILLTNPDAFRKENLYNVAEPAIGQGLFTAPVAKWKKNRKLLNPSFNQRILDKIFEIFIEQSEVLISVLQQHAGKGEIDIFDLVTKCTLDIICETAMGIQVKAQTTNPDFPIWLERALEIAMIRMFNIFYHFDIIFNNSPLGKEFHDACNKLRTFTRKVMTDKRIQYEKKLENNEDTYIEEESTKRVAFMDLLIEANYDKGKPRHFTDEELLDETLTFVIAGSDTIASTNCFVFTMLGMHQDVQDKVLAEILDVVGPDRAVEKSDLSKLIYLDRVIKESLRLFPVGFIIVRRLDEDINVGDHILQKGSSAVLGILRAHTNEQYWPNPFKFDPDRFLPEEVAKRVPGSYLPFSLGPRNCIGMTYAMMAIKALTTTVLRKYRIYTGYKDVKEIELKSNLFLRPKHGYKVSLELRT